MECNLDQIELRYTKKTGITGNTEVFFLHNKDSGDLLYTSPQVPSGSIMSFTVCIPKTEDDVYYLKYSDIEWNEESYVTIYNPYGAVSYSGHYETLHVLLFLSTPILKDSEWSVLSNREINWTDDLWKNDNCPTMEASKVAPYVKTNRVFVRKVFDALKTQPTAYEISVLYKHGVLVYVNGFEVYRDNFPDGVIHPDTINTNTHSLYEYRGVVRNAHELGSNKVVVAVEIHANEVITSFDAWLSIYGSSWNYLDAEIYKYPVTSALYMGNETYTSICDNSYTTTFSSQLSTYYFDFHINGQCNGLSYFVKSPYQKITRWRFWDLDTKLSILNAYIDPTYDTEVMYSKKLAMNNRKRLRLVVYQESNQASAITEIRPVLKYEEYYCLTPDVEDKAYISIVGETIYEILIPLDDYFMCSSLLPLPKGISLSKKCEISGIIMDVGNYSLPIAVFVDNCKTLYLTANLTIVEKKLKYDYYDLSYQTMPITCTVVFSLLIFLLAISFAWASYRRILKKQKQLQKEESSEESSVF